MISMGKIVFLLIALGLLFAAIFFTYGFLFSRKRLSTTSTVPVLDISKMSKFMRPVDKDDHIKGTLDARVKVVEFADFECPFCKKLHATMNKIMKDYKNKDVAWVYRHAFSDEIRKKSRQEAKAAECASELGGHKAFWDYADRIFALTPSEDGLDLSLLPQIATELGLNGAAFKDCLANQRHDKRITRDISDAMTSGARGTPYVIIVGKNDKRYDFSGAQPYEAVKNLIDLALGGT